MHSSHTDPAAATWAGNVMCQGTTETNKCIKTGANAIVANARKVYLNVSVWSGITDNTGAET